MKNKMLKIFVMLICIIMLFSGCGFNSGIALMKIESSTKTSWNQSHDFLSGTEKHNLYLGKEPQEMIIEVITEAGEIDITITDKNGEEIIFLDNAKTGIYEFIAEGKIKITINAKDHHGSFEFKEADS